SDRLVNSWSAFLSEKDAPMPANTAPQASKYDEALGALKRCAEGDDDDAKKAKKLLKAAEEEPSDEEKENKAKEAARAKADADRADADKRKAILGKRPDLSPAALSALSFVPTDKLEAE